MPRKPSIWWKASHGCWYVKWGGKLVRLDPDHGRSQEIYATMITTSTASIPPPMPAGPTVREIVARYLEVSARRVRQSTHESLSWGLGKLVEGLGDLRAADVRVSHVREWLDGRAWGRSSRTVYGTYVTMAFRWAVDEELIPAYHLTRLRRGGIERRTPVTEHEAGAFRAAIVRQDLADWWDLAVSCGARPGELWRLTAADIAPDRRSARTDAASKTGVRPIYFPAAVASILGRLCEARPEGPILRGGFGQPWNRGTLGKRFRAHAKLSGASVVPYHLRGLFASRCYAAGADFAEVQQLLGHRPSDVTRKFYLTIPRERLLAAVDAGWARAAG